MSIKVMTAVWEDSKQEGGGLLTLLAIADHADDYGYAYPGVDRLARRARVTPRHVRRLLRNLELSGELVIEPGAGPHGVNRYRVMLPTLTNCQPDANVRADPDVRRDLTSVSLPPDMHVTRSVSDPSENRQLLAAAPQTSTQTRKNRKAPRDYPPEFERAMSAYPSRPPGDSKPAAFRAWHARIADGISATDLIAGVERYAAYIRATGKDFILQASTFFGPDEHWKQPWAVPDPGRSGTGANPNGLANHRREPEIPSLEEELRRRRAVPL